MDTALSPALRVVCALLFLLSLVEGSNNTTVSESGITTYTGWHKGPAERGTVTILWSCLTTVFACTWTVLHLNVPYVSDRTSTKFWRKTKWMAVTVIFPEFIFAKAVCELQMAIEDLHKLKQQEVAFGWKVEYGRGCRLLYRIYHPHKTSLSRPPSELLSWSKTWTLTHSYFANMGGIVGDPGSNRYALVTAHALVECCVPRKHKPLGNLRLTKEDILDKSKADDLLKTVAALQILWLIVSVITRKVYDLPISLLEVCTVAFATLSITTYVANLAKPKDVDVPVVLYDSVTHSNDMNLLDLCGDSFFKQISRPTEQHGASPKKPRIKNDMLRLQAHGTQHVTLMYALAVSTMCFGAIHCAAWQNYFPSEVEMTLWQVASVLSSTLPLITLLTLIISNHMLGITAHKVIATMESFVEFPVKDASRPTQKPERGTNVTCVRLAWIVGDLWVEKKLGAPHLLSLEKSIRALIEVGNRVGKGEASRSWCTNYLFYWDQLSQFSSDTVYELVNNPEDVSNFRAVSYDTQIKRSDLSSEEAMQLILETINNPPETSQKLYEEWRPLNQGVNRVSSILAWLTGFLYAAARLALLAIAFAAFRKQDEGLYVDTWARFLPSIG
ncbi:hypothetical protein BKA58DRAFT_387032 [Alternaria rosae]|uniref:uncharacterized protein n=1 Tax=Alternaria rosae TaxID=1187941 RepID=UPI001E8D3168|nr:uncharacterized protein BKA58DRAFT_387032 [Alternaria rosae]KAH6868511.1 hypothetical protein BKA58DRAFT_387032 [Alternaria rosae]